MIEASSRMRGSVGQTSLGCKAQYDPVPGKCRITGGGHDIWGTGDDFFYFIWKCPVT
jgi:hypothetical protein